MDRTSLLARLIAFPTISSRSNLELVRFVKSYLAHHGVSSTIVPSPDGQKANLFATVGPMVEGGVVLSGHTDVVPEGGPAWTSDPWTLSARGVRLYGRGAVDMKGFVALMLSAVPDMLAAGLKAPVHLALSYDEEVGCKGAPALVSEMARRLPRPRAVVVGEPTRMAPVTGHKSSLSFFTEVRGRAAHSSRIDQGVSAVMVAARLVTWLSDRMDRARVESKGGAFLPPWTTLHCGMIEGGSAANVVAERCRFVTDIRSVPDESPEDYLEEYADHVRSVVEPAMRVVGPETGIDILPRGFVPGLDPARNRGAAEFLRTVGIEAAEAVVSYGTEAGIFEAAGWPAVVCGPGDIAQAHTVDEYIEQDEFEAGAALIARIVEGLS